MLAGGGAVLAGGWGFDLAGLAPVTRLALGAPFLAALGPDLERPVDLAAAFLPSLPDEGFGAFRPPVRPFGASRFAMARSIGEPPGGGKKERAISRGLANDPGQGSGERGRPPLGRGPTRFWRRN